MLEVTKKVCVGGGGAFQWVGGGWEAQGQMRSRSNQGQGQLTLY